MNSFVVNFNMSFVVYSNKKHFQFKFVKRFPENSVFSALFTENSGFPAKDDADDGSFTCSTEGGKQWSG